MQRNILINTRFLMPTLSCEKTREATFSHKFKKYIDKNKHTPKQT